MSNNVSSASNGIIEFGSILARIEPGSKKCKFYLLIYIQIVLRVEFRELEVFNNDIDFVQNPYLIEIEARECV